VTVDDSVLEPVADDGSFYSAGAHNEVEAILYRWHVLLNAT
jgi:hypothetical protein